MMLDVSNQLITQLEDNDIKYCHWKSNKFLSRSVNGDTDIDLLVDHDRESDVRDVLADLEFKMLQTASYSTYPSIEDYIGFDEETGKTVHLHLHFNLVLGKKYHKEFRIPWEQKILNDRVKDEESGVYITHPRHELLLLLVRYCLKLRWRNYLLEPLGRPLLRGDVSEEFYDLKEQVDREELVTATEELLDEGCVKYVSEIYRDDPTVWNLRKLKKSLPEEFSSYRRHSKFEGGVISKKREFQTVYYYLDRKLLNRTFPYRKVLRNGGKVIAFIGADGSGKSTVSRQTSDELGWQIDTKYIYFGHGDGSRSLLLAPIRFERFVGDLLSDNGSDSSHSEEELPSEVRNSVMLTIWKVVRSFPISFDKKRKIREMNKSRNNGRIVITDRYPNEVDELPDSPHLNQWADSDNWFLRFLGTIEKQPYERARAYPPDIVVLLNITPDVAVDRKRENTLERAEERVAQVERMEFPDDVDVVEVDATQELEDVIEDSLSAIWARM